MALKKEKLEVLPTEDISGIAFEAEDMIGSAVDDTERFVVEYEQVVCASVAKVIRAKKLSDPQDIKAAIISLLGQISAGKIPKSEGFTAAQIEQIKERFSYDGLRSAADRLANWETGNAGTVPKVHMSSFLAGVLKELNYLVKSRGDKDMYRMAFGAVKTLMKPGSSQTVEEFVSSIEDSVCGLERAVINAMCSPIRMSDQQKLEYVRKYADRTVKALNQALLPIIEEMWGEVRGRTVRKS